jgi:NAD(P)H dehydrogenase (quinone)
MERHMAIKAFLVTGATGDTGRPTVKSLLEKGHRVRALVLADDDSAAALRSLGAETVVGDMLNPRDMIAAAEGMTGAYFCFPVHPGMVQAAVYMAEAARRADLQVLVNLSQIAAREGSPNPVIRDHWVSEQIFAWSGVPTITLHPTFYLQWLLYPHAQASIIRDHVIDLPWGEGTHAPIAPEDIGHFAATVLDQPAAHIGKTYNLHGSVEMGQSQIASAAGEALGVDIVYRPLPMKAYEAQLGALGFPPFAIDFFRALAIDARDGVFSGSNDVFEGIVGRPPMTVQAFVTAHRARFAL